MKTSISVIKIMATVGLVLAASAAGAESWKLNCTNAGPNIPEPLRDRDKHSIMVQTATCIHEGGAAMDGAVSTQGVIWEHDANGSKLLSGDAVGRKPGATTAVRITEGTLTCVTKDGKVVGWTASGKGVFTLVVGGATELAGKSFSWTSRPTGPRTYVSDVTMD